MWFRSARRLPGVVMVTEEARVLLPPPTQTDLVPDPFDLDDWFAYRDVQRAGDNMSPLAMSSIGAAEEHMSGPLCLIKGEVLILAGMISEAKAFLRRAPKLAIARPQAVEFTLRAAELDEEFRRYVSEGDQARDARNWGRAEFDYWRALALYPLHCGYMVQYAHCLKEQGKFADAEIYYRSALALGAPARDVADHLVYAAHQQGYYGSVPLASADLPTNPLSPTSLPTNFDIEQIALFLTGQRSLTVAVRLELLRRCRTLNDVIKSLIGSPEFGRANHLLLLLLKTTGTQLPTSLIQGPRGA